MKKNLTELVFILDGSGSMAGLVDDTIGGFNGMIDQQKRESGEAYVSTVVFSDESRVVHDRKKLEEIPALTRREYRVGGCTALLDAVGDAMHHIANIHKYAREEDVPEHTLFVITTDGMENASRRWTGDGVRGEISRHKEKDGWEFLFLGANIDAVEAAGHLGIDADHAVDYQADSAGTRLNYEVLADAVMNVRCSGAVEKGWNARIREDFARRGGRKR